MRRRWTIESADAARDAWWNSSERWRGIYSETEWQRINDSLAPFRIVADENPLAGKLLELARTVDVPFPHPNLLPAPHRVAGNLRKTIDMIEALLTRLDDPSNYNCMLTATGNLLLPQLATRDAAQAALTALCAELQPRLDKLTKVKKKRSKAPMAHTEYWIELMRLWKEITAHDTNRRQHKHLSEFLLAVSKPVLPAETNEKALIAFVERYFPQMKT